MAQDQPPKHIWISNASLKQCLEDGVGEYFLFQWDGGKFDLLEYVPAPASPITVPASKCETCGLVEHDPDCPHNPIYDLMDHPVELLPCPFCGKESSGQEFGPGPYLSRSHNSLFKSVICSGCCSIASGETESRVIERWNTRTPTAQGDTAVEATRSLSPETRSPTAQEPGEVTAEPEAISDLRRAVGATSAAQPASDVAEAFSRIAQAMQADFNYAWSWHCNIAMSSHDEGMEIKAANRAAARFMKLCFDVDTSEEAADANHPPVSERTKLIREQQRNPASEVTAVMVSASISDQAQRAARHLCGYHDYITNADGRRMLFAEIAAIIEAELAHKGEDELEAEARNYASMFTDTNVGDD